MWERFSYYGMRALLILFMTAPIAAGGLGFDTAVAGAIYGLYTSMVYMTSLPGGWIADRLIGQRRAVLYGGIIIAIGHFSMAFQSLAIFYIGLTLIVVGTGFLKGNTAVIVGGLYGPGDTRRDAGFSIYYMGINLGAFIAPLVCGYLGQRVNWHVGFAAAGLGMMCGIIQYVMGGKYLGDAGLYPSPAASPEAARDAQGAFDDRRRAHRRRDRRHRLRDVFRSDADHREAGRRRRRLRPRRHRHRVFRVAVLRRRLDAGGTAAPLRHRRTVHRVGDLLVRVRTGRFDVESVRRSQHAAVGLRMVFPEQLLPVAAAALHHQFRAGVRVALDEARATRALEPGEVRPGPARLSAPAIAVLVVAATLAQNGVLVSPWWLVVTYLLHTWGELSLSPVGLSATTKLAPARVVGLMMGVFYLAISVGNFVGGRLSSLYGSMPLPSLFGAIAAVGLAAGFVLFALTPPIKRLMGDVN